MRTTFATALMIIFVTIPAWGQYEVDPLVNMNLYLSEASYANCDAIDEADFPLCEDVSSDPINDVAYLWVLASREGGWPMGFEGIQFGVEYGGTELLSWSVCQTDFLEIPTDNWPQSGSGNAIVWDCDEPSGEVAKVGFFSIAVGNTGAVHLTGDPRIEGDALWVDCEILVVEICQENLGSANLAMGTDPNCGNCEGGTPVEQTTWSQLKEYYR